MEQQEPIIIDALQAPFHHWKERVYVGFAMLLLAFIGVVITNIKQDGAWDYWRVICVIFAVLSLGLNFFLRKHETKTILVTIWHEIFHWVGLFLSVALVSNLVRIGIMGRFVASIEILTLLGLATFLIGVYIEISFVIVGLLLGIFALGLSVATTYLYPILIPVLLIGAAILWFYLRKKHSHHKKTSSGQ